MSLDHGRGLQVSTFGSTLDQLKVPEPTAEEKRKAALTVCGHADNIEDARELLSMLGLLEDE